MDEWRHHGTTVETAGGPVLRLLQQMFRFPVSVFVYTVEMFAATLRGVQQATEEGMAEMARTIAPGGPGSFSEAPEAEPEPGQPGAPALGAPSIGKEDRQMADTNLSDDMVKLVRFTIVSIKRDDEWVLYQDEILVTDNMTAEGFASWQIASYFQLDDAKKQPFRERAGKQDEEKFPHEDKKYLRVCFEVLCRWPRESLQYERRQLDELEGIRKAIEGK